MNCCICKKPMKPVFEDGDILQPDCGGEIRLAFAYGSEKFDLCPGETVYRGVICDTCAEPLVLEMVCTTQ